MISFLGHVIQKELVIFLMLTSFSVRAQQRLQYAKKAISRIEFSAGPGLVYVHKSNFLVDNRDMKAGFCASLGAVHVFSDRIEGAANLQYEIKGFGYTANFNDESGSPPVRERVVERVNLKYVSLNLAPRFLIGKNRKAYVTAGPYAAYLLGWKFYQEYYKNDVLVDKNSSTLYPYESYKKYDFGLMVAAAYSMSINSKFDGFIQLRYNLGLVDINQPPIDPLRTNAIYLLIGISLHK